MRTRASALIAAASALALAASGLVGCSGGGEIPQNSGTAIVEPQAQSAASSDEASKSANESEGENEDTSKATQASAYASLKRKVKKLVNATAMHVGVAFVDLSAQGDDAGFSINGSRSQVSASMIKLLILAEFLEENADGAFNMDESYTLKSSDIVGGTGSLQGSGAGTSVTMRELATKMIAQSDNVATNVLIDKMGMNAINAQADKIGLSGTELNRKMMDEASIAKGVENYITANDAALILRKIYAGELVSKKASEFALKALEAQEDSQGIAGGLPSGVVFAHKTGTLGTAQNDGGIVEADKPYVLVVLCEESGGSFSAGSAFSTMEQISSAVYEGFES